MKYIIFWNFFQRLNWIKIWALFKIWPWFESNPHWFIGSSAAFFPKIHVPIKIFVINWCLAAKFFPPQNVISFSFWSSSKTCFLLVQARKTTIVFVQQQWIAGILREFEQLPNLIKSTTNFSTSNVHPTKLRKTDHKSNSDKRSPWSNTNSNWN